MVDKKSEKTEVELLLPLCFAISFPEILWECFKCESPLAFPYASSTLAIEKLDPLLSVEKAALASHFWVLPPPAYSFGGPQNDHLF